MCNLAGSRQLVAVFVELQEGVDPCPPLPLCCGFVEAIRPAVVVPAAPGEGVVVGDVRPIRRDAQLQGPARGQEAQAPNLLAVIPEMRGDFGLLSAGPSSIVLVTVEAFIHGDVFLLFHVPDIDKGVFDSSWQSLFHWFKDECELVPDRPFRLRVKNSLKNEEEIAAFCRRFLIHDLQLRPDARWFDHVERGNGVELVPRLVAYLAAMFILSNVCRYEPERLAAAMRELNDSRLRPRHLPRPR